jgi:hypothetical protein
VKTITFHGFANGCQAFAEVVPSVDLAQIARIAKKRGKLASRVVYAELDDCGSSKLFVAKYGKIFSGDRLVAWFTISDLGFYLNPRQSV